MDSSHSRMQPIDQLAEVLTSDAGTILNPAPPACEGVRRWHPRF